MLKLNFKSPKLATITNEKKLIDTGAGFYLDEEDLREEKQKEKQIKELPRNYTILSVSLLIALFIKSLYITLKLCQHQINN